MERTINKKILEKTLIIIAREIKQPKESVERVYKSVIEATLINKDRYNKVILDQLIEEAKKEGDKDTLEIIEMTIRPLYKIMELE